MIIAISSLVAVAAIVYVLGVRPNNLPQPEPVSPFQHLDERKAAIYDNLRDLQFEYRVGKLSDADYQATKQDLQRELAAVMAEVDRLSVSLGSGSGAAPPAPAAPPPPDQHVCQECGASFTQPLKFCGECGKPMQAVQS
jgi:hypothetical protein